MSSPAVSHLFSLPETIEKLMFHGAGSEETNENKGASSIPVDILETSKEYVFYMDVPGLSKSDIQVTVEEERKLVVKSNGKRKREDDEEEGCKYIRMERRPLRNLMWKFRLPEDANLSAVSGRCENGILTVIVEKQPPPPKPKTVEIPVS